MESQGFLGIKEMKLILLQISHHRSNRGVLMNRNLRLGPQMLRGPAQELTLYLVQHQLTPLDVVLPHANLVARTQEHVMVGSADLPATREELGGGAI